MPKRECCPRVALRKHHTYRSLIMASNEDRLAKDVWILGAISGILGGLFDSDCIVDGFVEDIDPEEIEGFFLDE